MRIIGVTGMSGAGKTTFSDYLATKEKIGVIHIDDILNKIKLKYFKFILKKDKSGESTKVDFRLVKRIYSNAVIFNIFMKLEAKMIEKRIEERIKELEKDKQIVIIDDTFITYHKLYKQMDTIFYIKRPYKERQEALQERDKMSKEEVIAHDIVHHKGIYKTIKGRKRTIEIENNGSREELQKKADEIYEKELELSRKRIRKKYEIQEQPRIKEEQKNRYKNDKSKDESKYEVGEGKE